MISGDDHSERVTDSPRGCSAAVPCSCQARSPATMGSGCCRRAAAHSTRACRRRGSCHRIRSDTWVGSRSTARGGRVGRSWEIFQYGVPKHPPRPTPPPPTPPHPVCSRCRSLATNPAHQPSTPTLHTCTHRGTPGPSLRNARTCPACNASRAPAAAPHQGCPRRRCAARARTGRRRLAPPASSSTCSWPACRNEQAKSAGQP